jgi:hypothetical protein
MNSLPDRMRDRWLDRVEPAIGSGTVYWHILMGGCQEALEAATDVQAPLVGFPGLHMTPLKWLHITTLVVGPASEITRRQMSAMTSDAQRLLRDVSPISATIDRVCYHPEAIVLPIHPASALKPILHATHTATINAIGARTGIGNGPSPSWWPHMTTSYSTADQSAEPIISALGTAVRRRTIVIDSVALVVQWGPERLWNWEPVGVARLSAH